MVTVKERPSHVNLTFDPEINLDRAEQVVAELGSSVLTQKIRADFTNVAEINTEAAALLANVLGQYAERDLLDSKSVRKATEALTRSGLFAALTAKQTGRIEAPKAPDVLYVTSLENASSTSPDEFASFHHRFSGWLQDFQHATQLPITPDWLRCVSRLCYHAVQNVYDHAYRKPFPERERIYSYFSIQRAALTPGADRDLQDYQRSLQQRLVPGQDYPGFVEILVNDDGAGIAARQAMDGDVYSHAIQAERTALADALRPRGTVKVRARDTTIRGVPGFGTTDILQQVRDLHAYLRIRTGRLRVTVDGTRDHDYVINDAVLGCVPGTVLHVIVPLPPRRSA